MKQILFVLLLAPYGALANTTNLTDQFCGDEARHFLSQKLQIKLSDISFFNGALVGDGVNSVEINSFLVNGKQGLYKVELDADDCRLRSIERINN